MTVISNHNQAKEAIQSAVNQAIGDIATLDLIGGTEHVVRDDATGEVRIEREPIRAKVTRKPQPPVEPPAPTPLPTVKVIDETGATVAEFPASPDAIPSARADADARANANKGHEYFARLPEYGYDFRAYITPPPPPVPIPPATSIDINALLAGAAKTYWCSIDGTGTGATANDPASFKALYDAKKLQGSVAVRLIADPQGREYVWPFTTSNQWAHGESADKPCIVAPADLNGPLIRVKGTDGLYIHTQDYIVVYGMAATKASLTNLSWVRIVNCNFVGADGNGVKIVDTRQSPTVSDNALIGCLIADAGTSGIFSQYGRGWTIDSCIIDRCGTSTTRDHALYLQSANGWRVTNCFIGRPADTGIKVQACDGLLVAGNVFYGGKSIGSPNANGTETSRDRKCVNLVWKDNVASDASFGFYCYGLAVDSECSGNIWTRCGAIYQFIAPPDGPNDTPLTNVRIHHEKLWNSGRLAYLSLWHSDAVAGDRFRTNVRFDHNDVQGDTAGHQRYVSIVPISTVPTDAQIDLALKGISWDANRIWREPDYATGGKSFYTPVKVADGMDVAEGFKSLDWFKQRTGDTSTLQRVKWKNPRGVPEVAAEMGLTVEQLIAKLRTREVKVKTVYDAIRDGFTEVN